MNNNNNKSNIMLKELTNKELIEINGGGPLWDAWLKSVEDTGQYVGGFIYGLFVGECPSEC
ncbi:bacteriocin [Polaribacter cellanae]|uniref:Bacteriocin n=1 Tax=Polaribacter cellanae TaxID=2818493 RepID=A0A975CNP1_9FLAO|nr:bacteriocin [Polaribacter cellanae]QTE22432.1 bacteriocin [Polaribacter cellanae]